MLFCVFMHICLLYFWLRTRYVGICAIIYFMHESAHTWTPVIALNCICVQTSVCLCKSVCKQAYFQTDIIETDGSGALHTLVWALIMPAYCVVLCMCVLLWVCSSLHVCAVAVCYSLQRPGLVLRPLMVSEREAPADREPGLTWEHPRQHTREEKALCVLWHLFIKGFCWTPSDSTCDSLLLLLPNQRHISFWR